MKKTEVANNDLNMMEAPDENDLNNPMILSKTEAVGRWSFADDREEFNPIAPPPKYFTSDFILKNFS